MDKTKPNCRGLCPGMLCVLAILLSPALAVNQLVSLQGRVLQSGSPATSGNLAVTIWSNQTGGTPLYSDNFQNAINDGFFDLMLGSSSELNLTYGTLYYLDLYVDGDDINWTSPSGATVNRIEFQSRNGQIPAGRIQYNAINASQLQPDSINATHILGGAITAAKMAFNAINASHIIDNAITTAKIVNDAITSAKIAPSAVNSSHLSAGLALTGNGSIDSPTLFVDSTSHRVGIGTASPVKKLEVVGEGNFTSNVFANGDIYANYLRSQLNGTSGGILLKNNAGSYRQSMYYAGSGSSGNLVIGSEAENAVVFPAGTVGIGTTSPSNRLVVSNGGATGIEIEPGGYYSGTNGVDFLSYDRTASAYRNINFIASSPDLGFLM